MARLLAFLVVFTTILGGLHYYVWVRLFRDAWPGLPAKIAGAVLALLCLSIPAGFLLRRSLGWLALVPLVWIGVSFLLLLGTVAADVVRGALRLAGMPADPGRRELLRKGLSTAALAATGGLTAFSIRSASGDILHKELAIKLGRLPHKISGFTIVQLTDMHIGGGLTIGRKFVESVVEQTNRLRPDMIAITGDLVDGSVAQLAELVAPLAMLQARYGVYFVTGNHEYFSGARQWVQHLPKLGIQTLLNQRVPCGDGPYSFDLIGIEDYSGVPDLPRTLVGRDPERELLLLAHQPRAVGDAAKAGVGLQLSGHTHGGQIQPFGALVGLTQPYIAGLHRHGEHTQIYVSRGTGYWGPPMRLGAPAEITKLILIDK